MPGFHWSVRLSFGNMVIWYLSTTTSSVICLRSSFIFLNFWRCLISVCCKRGNVFTHQKSWVGLFHSKYKLYCRLYSDKRKFASAARTFFWKGIRNYSINPFTVALRTTVSTLVGNRAKHPCRAPLDVIWFQNKPRTTLGWIR